MALNLTVESFLQLVRQSGLIDANQVQTLLAKYAERGVDVKKSQAIADAMVGDDVLTKWQAEKLLNGKHKGFFLGKYRLLGLLGKGGMSSVYLAEHTLMKRRCAIKVLPSQRVNDSSYLARFHREAQAVASVDHPNIVRAYDVDCAQDKDSQIHFLVMEYVPGQSLQELVMERGPLDYAEAVDYIRQSAAGLDHAHRAGMVHRDIKPGNLLVDTNGTIKILDMGLARFFDDRETSSLTVAHEEKVLGTADYLAPEQAMDSHSVDTRADLYSLGCSLYFLLTGKPPFDEGTLTQRLMWHQTKPFPPITNSRLDCPASLTAILEKMVQKDPNNRYQTGAEVAAACHQWLIENAGADWQQKIGAKPREPSVTPPRVVPPSRDLQSDSVVQRDENLPKTKISVQPKSGVPASMPPAKPKSAPKVTAAPAQPAKPTNPPVAKPVIPVARPVEPPAAPAIPVAKPVIPVAQPVAPATPAAKAQVATNVPVVEPVEESDEPENDEGIFSLFGQDQESTSVIAPDTRPLDDAASGTLTSFHSDETPSPTRSDSTVKRAKSSPNLAATAKNNLARINWKQPKVLAAVGGTLALLIGLGVWMAVGRAKPTISKGKGKVKQGLETVVDKQPKEDLHEVTIHVGGTSEYSSIGRALHAIVEEKDDYEKKANGKPLRFVIEVAVSKPYAESVTIGESFPGELHLRAEGATRPQLKPATDEPAISILDRSGVTVEGFTIALNPFAAASRGIAISGKSPRCRIKNCAISDIGKAGIEITEAAGLEPPEGIVIENVTFQTSGAASTGVLVAGKAASQHVTLQRCRFVGAMGAAIAVQAPVESLNIKQCGVSGAVAAVQFAGGILLKAVLIDQCSFKLNDRSKAGLRFEAQPADGSTGFTCRNTLFAGLKAPEVLVAEKYDAKKFDEFLSAEKPSENNWSDRPAPAKTAANERDLIEQRVAMIEFADTGKPSNELFLVPKAGAPYKTAGVKAK